MFQKYDGERGNGVAAAQRFRITGYPTLIVLDGQGNELMRGGFVGPAKLGTWLEETAASAVSGKAFAALLKKRPRDLALLTQMAQRARASDDAVAERRWLRKIEAADRSPGRPEAASASWRQAELRVVARLEAEARRAAQAHLRRFPGMPMQALAVLAASGADRKTLEAEYRRVFAAVNDPGQLNGLVYNALGAGAFDAALLGAQKQVKLAPEEANPYDTLAEVHNYRGEKDKAVATEKLGMTKKVEPELLVAMRENLARFEAGGRTPDARAPSSFDRLFESKMLFTAGDSRDPGAITRRMFDDKKAVISEACSAKAKGLKSALMRLTVGAGAVLSKVEVLEPDATAALKKCMVDAARKLTIPADNPAVRVLVEVPFAATAPGTGS